MPPLTFKELKRTLNKEDETILALGEDEKGFVKIVKNYGGGVERSKALAKAMAQKSDFPFYVFVKSL